jgi:tetratricopeptide (TPR) repeat protein
MEVCNMKKRIFIAGALLLVFAVAVAAAPEAPEAGQKKMSKKAAKLMDKAYKAIREKQADQAIDLLNQVVALEPENAMVRHNLAVMLHQKGQTDESIASFEEALRLDPAYVHALQALRQALFEAGKGASNQKDFAKANSYLLKLDALPVPQGENKALQAYAAYLLGFNFFNLKQNDKAGEFFAKCQAVEGLPTDNRELFANATYFLGMLDHMQNAYAKSNENFRKYLALYGAEEAKPEFFAHANYFVGANLFRLLEAKVAKGEMDGVNEATAEIMPYLEKAIVDKIPSEDPYVMLGNCYVFRKEIDKAIQTYQKLIEAFPQSAQLQNYKTFISELQKNQPKEKGKKKK